MRKKVSEKKQTRQGPETLYMVLKKCTHIDIPDPFQPGKIISTKLNGLDGFVPMFYDRAAAEKEAMDGKYEILAVETGKR